MFRIGFEFNMGAAFKAGESALPPGASAELLEVLTECWVRNAAIPYANLNAALRLHPITVRYVSFEQDTSFEVAFNSDLLANLFEIYPASGWGALEKIEAAVGPLPIRFRQTKEFFGLTKTVVAVMVAHALVAVEQKAATYALRKWTNARERLVEYQKAFKRGQGIVTGGVKFTLIDRTLGRELFSLCQEYAREAKEALRLQRKMDERNLKDSRVARAANMPKTRKSAGSELRFQVFAAPQREHLNKMAEILRAVAARVPAAVFVIDDLPTSVLDSRGPNQTNIAAQELENNIYGGRDAVSHRPRQQHQPAGGHLLSTDREGQGGRAAP